MKRAWQIGLALLLLSTSMHASQARYRRVSVDCENPGTHQDVAKTPEITNTSRHDIAANVKIYWEASDGDKGYILGPLKKNKSVSGLGEPGNSYTCTAYYLTKIVH